MNRCARALFVECSIAVLLLGELLREKEDRKAKGEVTGGREREEKKKEDNTIKTLSLSLSLIPILFLFFFFLFNR